MNKIWKFPLGVESREMFMMPKGAEVISVVIQNQIPVLYARVDPDAPLEQRLFRLITTGEDFGEGVGDFVGTFVVDGWYVAHLFEQSDGTQDVSTDRFEEDRKEAAKFVKDKS